MKLPSVRRTSSNSMLNTALGTFPCIHAICIIHMWKCLLRDGARERLRMQWIGTLAYEQTTDRWMVRAHSSHTATFPPDMDGCDRKRRTKPSQITGAKNRIENTNKAWHALLSYIPNMSRDSVCAVDAPRHTQRLVAPEFILTPTDRRYF